MSITIQFIANINLDQEPGFLFLPAGGLGLGLFLLAGGLGLCLGQSFGLTLRRNLGLGLGEALQALLLLGLVAGLALGRFALALLSLLNPALFFFLLFEPAALLFLLLSAVVTGKAKAATAPTASTHRKDTHRPYGPQSIAHDTACD